MKSLTPRRIQLLMFSTSALLLLVAIFIEPFKSMEPCPMCMMQRAAFVAIAICALFAVMHNPGATGQRVYAALTFVSSTVGAAIASRQLWLQSLPEDRVPACGPGLEYMLEVFPLLEVIEMAIVGTGDCAKVQWTWLNISIPGWSLLAFVGFALLSLGIIFRMFTAQTRPALTE